MSDFLQNKYIQWLYNIIFPTKTRGEISGYDKKHHVIPKRWYQINCKFILGVQ